jgi:hypothetical protein
VLQLLELFQKNIARVTAALRVLETVIKEKGKQFVFAT